ncbi:hypothetical protein PUR59_35200 [Streptomyces sp. SP18ES09]|uniref:hypothetical protein n=1 Tax=Streptomyces sp. SP18ES09 TaxID=3002532 RepID=UPI002E77AF51|nr:hypothetical protein [Streptomyces sp. SP18ES09]MEE1820246.1 hypothetical protein [Streptomyces sp. SP18ES09]
MLDVRAGRSTTARRCSGLRQPVTVICRVGSVVSVSWYVALKVADWLPVGQRKPPVAVAGTGASAIAGAEGVPLLQPPSTVVGPVGEAVMVQLASPPVLRTTPPLGMVKPPVAGAPFWRVRFQGPLVGCW